MGAPASKNFGQSWPGIAPDIAAKLDEAWVELQKDYTTLSSDSRLVTADHAAHFLQNDEPELVLSSIFSLLDKARQK